MMLVDCGPRIDSKKTIMEVPWAHNPFHHIGKYWPCKYRCAKSIWFPSPVYRESEESS